MTFHYQLIENLLDSNFSFCNSLYFIENGSKHSPVEQHILRFPQTNNIKQHRCLQARKDMRNGHHAAG